MTGRLLAWWTATEEAERGHFVLWLPVGIGAGIALYFALAQEPWPWLGASLALPAALLTWGLRARPRPRALAALGSAVALGFAAIQFATYRAMPVEPLPARAVIVAGTVAAVALLADGGQRVTLRAPQLGAQAAPLRRDLRIRLRADDPARPGAGDRLSVRALLRAPQPPSWPGAWDAQRDAFFAGLAGGGIALGHASLDVAAPASSGPWRAIQRMRETITRRFAEGMPGAAGAIGGALFTGLTAAIPRAEQEAFRASGLAHLLSVSGLHVAIVIGLVFGAVRILLALSEQAALRWPCKQIAALAGLAAALAYTPLAGAQVPLLRSVAMAALVVLGVLVGRRALTLRGLALAAAAVLLAVPWELLGPSLQMSFSAVLALIAGHTALRPALLRWRADAGWARRMGLYFLALAMTSLLAGAASAPFGVYHFGRVQLYFILANLAAVPLAGLWIMPWGMVALALMPFGLEAVAFAPMRWGLEATLWLAHATAALPAASLDVPHMPLWGLLATTLGLLWLGLWRAGWRVLGVVPLLLGLASPALHRPADALLSGDARLMALRAGGQVYLHQERGGASRFAREALARYWAAAEPIRLPAQHPDAVACADGTCRIVPRPGGAAILLAMAERPAGAEGCAGVVLVLGTAAACPGTPSVTRRDAWQQGAHAIWLEGAGARILTDRDWRGERPWVAIPPRHRPDLPPAATE